MSSGGEKVKRGGTSKVGDLVRRGSIGGAMDGLTFNGGGGASSRDRCDDGGPSIRLLSLLWL